MANGYGVAMDMAVVLYWTVALYSMLQLDHLLLLQPTLHPPIGFGYGFG